MRKDLVTTITKKRLLWSVLGFILGLVFLSIAVAEEGSYTNTIMHPDRETRLGWIESYERAPLARIDDELKFRVPLRGSLSLLSRLNYTPSERDQGSCGNCWAWAGTGVMGIVLDVEGALFFVGAHETRLLKTYIEELGDSKYGQEL